MKVFPGVVAGISLVAMGMNIDNLNLLVLNGVIVVVSIMFLTN